MIKELLFDERITCADCSTPFIWSVGEQRWYESRDMTRPKRCKPCRERIRATRAAGQPVDPRL